MRCTVRVLAGGIAIWGAVALAGCGAGSAPRGSVAAGWQGTALPLTFYPAADGGLSARLDGGALALNRSGVRVELASSGHVRPAFTLSPVGARTVPAIGTERLPGVVNELVGPRRDWRVELPTFARARYAAVWPGVGLTFYGHGRTVEFDVDLARGADPGRIVFAVRGAGRLRIDRAGDLVVNLTGGKVRLLAPHASQGRKLVPSAWRLLGHHRVGLRVGRFDRSRGLTVDPTLLLASYFGGAGIDDVNGVGRDGNGNIFVAGTSSSNDLAVTGGAYQSTNKGGSGDGNDAFVAKLSPDGRQRLYTTYLGGTDDDDLNAIAVDGSGDAYLTGITYSTNFPVTAGVLDSSHTNNGSCCGTTFVTKLAPDGSRLLYSTYLGNSGQGNAIAVDPDGEAFVAGFTNTNDFPTTSGTPQTTFGGINGSSADAYLVKINPTATGLVYSTLIRGTTNGIDTTTHPASTTANGLALDATGAAYVVGNTDTTDFPTVNDGGSSRTRASGNGFITKVAADGSAFAYSTYLTGDTANAVALDAADQAYVTGADHSNVRVDQLNAAGQSGYGTAIGPGEGFGIAADSTGRVYVAGEAGSGYVITSDAAQKTFGGGFGDGFLTALSPSGSVSYSTYLGGSGNDNLDTIAFNGPDRVIVGGSTASTDFPTLSGLQARAGGGGQDGIFAAYDITPPTSETTTSTTPSTTTTTPIETPPPAAAITIDAPSAPRIAVGDTVTVDGTSSSGENLSYSWSVDGRTLSGASGAQVPTSFDLPGDHTVGLVVRDAAGRTASATRSVAVSPAPAYRLIVDPGTPRVGQRVTVRVVPGSGNRSRDAAHAAALPLGTLLSLHLQGDTRLYNFNGTLVDSLMSTTGSVSFTAPRAGLLSYDVAISSPTGAAVQAAIQILALNADGTTQIDPGRADACFVYDDAIYNYPTQFGNCSSHDFIYQTYYDQGPKRCCKITQHFDPVDFKLDIPTNLETSADRRAVRAHQADALTIPVQELDREIWNFGDPRSSDNTSGSDGPAGGGADNLPTHTYNCIKASFFAVTITGNDCQDAEYQVTLTVHHYHQAADRTGKHIVDDGYSTLAKAVTVAGPYCGPLVVKNITVYSTTKCFYPVSSEGAREYTYHGISFRDYHVFETPPTKTGHPGGLLFDGGLGLLLLPGSNGSIWISPGSGRIGAPLNEDPQPIPVSVRIGGSLVDLGDLRPNGLVFDRKRNHFDFNDALDDLPPTVAGLHLESVDLHVAPHTTSWATLRLGYPRPLGELIGPNNGEQSTPGTLQSFNLRQHARRDLASPDHVAPDVSPDISFHMDDVRLGPATLSFDINHYTPFDNPIDQDVLTASGHGTFDTGGSVTADPYEHGFRGFALKAGPRFDFAGASVAFDDNAAFPIYPPFLYLKGFDFVVTSTPFAFGGHAHAQNLGGEVYSVDGCASYVREHVTGGQYPWCTGGTLSKQTDDKEVSRARVEGTAKLLGLFEIAHGFVEWDDPGGVQFGFSGSSQFGDFFPVKEIDVSGSFRDAAHWQLRGTGKTAAALFCATDLAGPQGIIVGRVLGFFGANPACYDEGAALVDQEGAAVCVSALGAAMGVGVRWHPLHGVAVPTLGGCDTALNEFATPSAVREATSTSFRLTGHDPFDLVLLKGVDPNGVTVTGPAARRIVPRHANSLRGDLGRDGGVYYSPLAHETVVIIRRPASGTWHVSSRTGAITSLEVLDGLPKPHVTASLAATAAAAGGAMTHVLTYRLRAIPGQRVTFIEHGPSGDRTLGSTTRTTGRLRFTSASGPGGVRTIEALVDENGTPRDMIIVARYRAAAARALAAPAKLVLRRRGSSLVASWRPVASASAYAITLSSIHGRSETRVLVGRAATEVTFTLDVSHPAKVVVIATAPDRTSKATVARIGPGHPAAVRL